MPASEQEVVSQLSEDDRTPDLVIADFPFRQGAKGGDAIDAIRRRWGQRVPGLLLTGDTDPERLEEATARGFQVVKKPIRPEKLKAVVAEQIETVESDAKDRPPGGGKKTYQRAVADT